MFNGMAIVVTEVKYPQYPKGLHEAIAEAERLEADPKNKTVYRYERNVDGPWQMIYEVIWTIRLKKLTNNAKRGESRYRGLRT